MRRSKFRVAGILGATALAGALMAVTADEAAAHALWTDPKPRDDHDGYKPPPREPNFVLPCGVARKSTQPINKLTVGASRMVAWTETVPHPGCFLIEFAKSDTSPFQQLKVVKRTKTGGYQQEITLPSEACTGCVLRLRQVMLGSDAAVCPPANLSDLSPTLYYSCANIELEGGAGGGMGGGAAGAAGGAGGTGGAVGGAGGAVIGGAAGGGAGGAGGTGGAVATGGTSGGAGGSGASAGAAGGGAAGAAGSPRGGSGGSTAGGAGGSGDDEEPAKGNGGGGCVFAIDRAPHGWFALAFGFVALALVRRRRG